MEDFYSYRPSEGHGLKYNPLPTIIGPRPIAWISSISPNGIFNLAPYSFFNLFNYTPPIIGFSSVGYKDSLRNIEASKDFVCNIIDASLVDKMNQTSAPLAYEVSEFEDCGVNHFSSDLVQSPRVLEAKVSLECKLSKIIQLSDSKGVATEAWMVLAEVVQVHINQKIIKDGVMDLEVFRHILRGGGKSEYYEVGVENIFNVDRPKKPLHKPI